MNTSFTLHPISPFRLDYTVFALRRREKNIIDRWDGTCYRRVFVIEKKPIKVTVTQSNSRDHSEVIVLISEPITPLVQEKITRLIEMMFTLKRDFHDFYTMTQQDAQINPLVLQFMGLRPTRFPSIFEALINAISCQQISLDAGLQIQNRLIQYIGTSVPDEDDVFYAFPSPEDVSLCSINELKKIGYSTHKSETIRHIASVIKNETAFEHLENKENEEIINFLSQFKGIGRWTAEYLLLRGLGRLEIFPAEDVGAQNNLQKLLHLQDKLDYHNVTKITASWYPYAGFVYFHLLLHKLDEKGVLKNGPHCNQAYL